MGIYQVSIKKRVHSHEWTNAYVIVMNTLYSQDELGCIADTVAPKLVTFERFFLSEEVEIICSETVPICEPRASSTAWRAGDHATPNGQNVAGLRPIAIEESTGPAITLLLGLQPITGHWGRKDYRFALHRDDIEATTHGYRLRHEARMTLDTRLAQAKLSIRTLLQADEMVPCLAVSASTNAHLLESYRCRRVRDIIIKGVHINKHRR